MKNILVSIITPTFNHAKYIAECIESVQAQTYQNWEMIIIDDGSQDDAKYIIQKYAESDPRVKAHFQKNKGIWLLSETYNYALQQSKGELIAILEGDDYWPEYTLSTLVEYMDSHRDYGMAYGHSITVGIRSGEIIGTSIIIGDYEHPAEFAHQIYTPIARIPPQAAIIRKQALDTIGGFVQHPALPLVDRPTFLALSIRYKIGFLDRILAYWRQHGSNTTRVLSLRMVAGAIPWVDNFFNTLDGDTIRHLKIKRSDALNIHRKLALLKAMTYMHDLENPNPINLRWSEITTWVMPHLLIHQRLILKLERVYLAMGLDMRGFVKAFKHVTSGSK